MSSGAAGPFYLPNSEAAVVWFLRIPASVSCCYYFFFYISHSNSYGARAHCGFGVHLTDGPCC